jgi:Pseudomonas avirulence D protein (AvrD)
MNELRSIERYATVDDVLGDAETRYFGSGYRNVKQRVFEIRIDTQKYAAAACAEVLYPASWSTKQNKELTPHLSSIDGFVIAAQLMETYLREAYGLDDVSSRDCWIRRCTVKSGQTPTLELARIPVSLRLVSTKSDASAMCGYLSNFTIVVGSLQLEILVDHAVAVQRRVRVSFGDVECCLGEQQEHYLAGGYKNSRVTVSDVSVSRPTSRARARFSVDYDAAREHGGLSAAHFPFISIPDALVGTAQLAQTLLYRQDNITRATSKNMWMRKFTVTIPRPAVPEPKFEVETWISQANVLSVGGSNWRTAKFNVTLPSMTAAFALAHELPAAQPELAIAV